MKKTIIILMSLCCMIAQAAVKDLSRKETANCYMVPSGAAQYSFNALVRGNGVAIADECATIKASEIKAVKLLWQDAPVVDAKSVVFTGSKIEFWTLPGTKTGNAVIAIYSDKSCREGSCLWSWHIWMTDAGDCEMAGVRFMDRNLGADGTGLQANGRNGLFYQWGRKDPFEQNGELTVPVVQGKQSIDYTWHNPRHFVTRDGRWCSDERYDMWCKGSSQQDCQSVRVTPQTKTMYDPCPAGYHVPNYCDILAVKASGSHGFIKAGARWYDFDPATPDKVGEFGYYWCATVDRHYLSRGSDYYIWNVGVGIGMGSHYYTCSAFSIRPQKF